MRKHLALIIRGTPAIEMIAAHHACKWWRLPLVQRVCRLNIVVTIDYYRRTIRRPKPIGIDDWMAARRNNHDPLHSDLTQMACEPLRTSADIAGILASRADRRKRDKLL